MKTLSIILVIIGFSFFMASGQKTSKASGHESVAVIEFAQSEYDFGNLSYGTMEERKIEFVNTGSVPLVLKKVKTSCGCTASEWPKTPIKPGEKSELTVRYNTSKKGKFRKSLTIVSNAENSIVTIGIKGNVKVPEDLIVKGQEKIVVEQ